MRATLNLTMLCLLFLFGCSTSRPARTVDPELSRTALSARRAFDRGRVEDAARLYGRALNQARSMDDAPEIANNAYNLAVCRVVLEDYAEAKALLEEARGEYEREGESPADLDLLEANIALREGEPDTAQVLLESALSRELAPTERLDFIILRGRVALSRGEIDAARTDLKEVRDRIDDETDPLQRAEVAGLAGEVLSREGDYSAAAEEFDRRTDLLRKGNQYGEMALAEKRAGEAWREAGKPTEAAERFFRAARSLYAQGDLPASLRTIEEALAAAEAGGAKALQVKIVALFNEIKETVESAKQ